MSAALAESTLQLSGLHCAACAPQIEAALAAVAGVAEAQVNAAASRARVRWDPRRTQPSALVAAVHAVGYGAAPDTAAGARALRAREERQWLWRFFVAAFCAMQVMMLATPVYVADAGTLAPDLEQLLHRSAWTLTLPVLFFSSAPFFVSAWRSLTATPQAAAAQRPSPREGANRLGAALRRFTGRLGMDVPVALGIAVAFVASSGAAFDPGGAFGREVYFDSLTMFVAFLLAGRWLEARARHRAIEAVERLAHAAPRLAWRLAADGSVERVAIESLAVGERVRVPVGEVFPADGTIDEGTTSVDEALLTGESRPVAKRAGEGAVAGSANLGAPVALRVERVGADTRQEQIAALMREALARRPTLVGAADRIAGPFLATVLLLALGAGLWWWPTDPSRALWVATSVLIVTCPCALSLAAPSAWLAAASALAKRGVLLRRIDALETLARVRHVVLDKTGTVTASQPVMRALPPHDAEVAARAAALATWSSHPLARALVAATPAPRAAWRDVSETPGCGLEGRDDAGRRWRLGSARWLGVEPVPGASLYFGPAEGGAATDFSFDETLRDGAAEAVRALKAQGVVVSLLSGDTAPRVERLAERLGIAQATAAATPERKLALLRDAQAAGVPVAMVGDGVNDAPVLAQADVSFAMADGASIAHRAADAVLMSGRLSDVPHAVELARRARRVMRQNLAWAALYNAACVPLALAGWLPPWAAGLGMAASSLFVVLNALRLSKA